MLEMVVVEEEAVNIKMGLFVYICSCLFMHPDTLLQVNDFQT